MSVSIRRILGLTIIALFLFLSYQNCAPSGQDSFSSTTGGTTTGSNTNPCWDCYPDNPTNPNNTPSCDHEIQNTRNMARINPATGTLEPIRDYIPSDARLSEPVFSSMRNFSQMRIVMRTNFPIDQSVQIYDNRIDRNFLNTQVTAQQSRHLWTLPFTRSTNDSTGSLREWSFTLNTRDPQTGGLNSSQGTFTRWYTFVRNGQEICSTRPTTFRIVPSCGLRLTNPTANRCYNGTQGSAGIELTTETQLSSVPVSNNFPLVWYRAATSDSNSPFTAQPVQVPAAFVSGNQYRHSHGPPTNVIGGAFRLWYDQVDPRTGEVLCRSEFVDYTVAQNCN